MTEARAEERGARPPPDAVAAFCRRHHIRKLSLFGSVLRDDFGPDSDVDVLVEFEPGHVVGFEILDMEEELSRLVGGRKVDIVNEKYLNRWLRERVLAAAEVQFQAEVGQREFHGER